MDGSTLPPLAFLLWPLLNQLTPKRQKWEKLAVSCAEDKVGKEVGLGKGGRSAGISGRAMFTHYTVNFAWHQLPENTLLHASHPSHRKKKEKEETVMCSTLTPFLFSSSSWLPSSSCLVFSGPAVLRRPSSAFAPHDAKQRGNKTREEFTAAPPAKPPTGFVSPL